MANLGRYSRRQFLAACGGNVAAASFLTVYGRAALSAGPETTVALARQEAQEIRLLIRDDIRSAYAADGAVERWNSENESQITLDVPPAAADISQRIQAAQASGDLIWDGYAVMVVPWDSAQWVSRNLIQPLDDYIEASEIPDADQVVPGIIPSILESTKVDGQQYALPGNVGSVALAWLTEAMDEAGVDFDPVSWDEVHEAARMIQEAVPDVTPFDSATTPLTDLWSMIWGATDTPLTDDGLVDITSEASFEALEWMRMMVEEGLMPPVRPAVGSGNNENFQNWQRGGTGIITSYDVAATIVQQTFGIDAAVNGLNMRRDREEQRAGTPFWVNSCVVLTDASNPQGMTDFYLWWFGPNNEETGRQIAEVAAKPSYQYTYDQFIEGRPEYEWQLESIEVVRESVPFPVTTTISIQQAETQPWVERVIGSEQMDPEEAMNNALEDIQRQIDRQLS
jgi:ABC-type glycerol-3-phosphate transport system substrate-binding protein